MSSLELDLLLSVHFQSLSRLQQLVRWWAESLHSFALWLISVNIYCRVQCDGDSTWSSKLCWSQRISGNCNVILPRDCQLESAPSFTEHLSFPYLSWDHDSKSIIAGYGQLETIFNFNPQFTLQSWFWSTPVWIHRPKNVSVLVCSELECDSSSSF